MKKIILLSLLTFFLKISYSQITYRFIGNGYWTDSSNWINNLIPPDSLQNSDSIYVSPLTGDSCILNKTQTILKGATIIVSSDANFIIIGGLTLMNPPKLKRILYPKDSAFLLCNPPCSNWIITQGIETFIYDSFDRLIRREFTRTRVDDFSNIMHTDTLSYLNYQYNMGNSIITGYFEKKYDSTYPIVNHILVYDFLNRLILDSISNPQVSNNKITRFTYLMDTVLQYEVQSFPAGVEIKFDTMLLAGNNVVQENITFNSTRWEFKYSLSSYRNPLSYVNNFSLLSSDNKNSSNSSLFMIHKPQFITYNLTNSTIRKYWSASSSGIPQSQFFTITVDSFNTVQSYIDSYSGNKLTTFEYY